MTSPKLSLSHAVRVAEISTFELYYRYVAIGGDLDVYDMWACVITGACTRFNHNAIAQALNEHFQDLDADHPVGYRDLPTSMPPSAETGDEPPAPS